MQNTIGKEELLGFLRDSGVSEVIVGRLGRLIDAFNGNIPQFMAATDGQLAATYNKFINPEKDGTKKKGLGESTLTAFDMLRRQYAVLNKRNDAAVKEKQEKDEATTASAVDKLKAELLARNIDLKVLSETVAWLQIAFGSVTLGELITHYDKFMNRQKKD